MLTIDDVIASCEKSAERYHKAFLRNKAHGGEFYQREAESDRICEEHERQLAAWLRELVERRKEPEIVHCGECRWYGRANKQRFYRGMDCLQRRISTIVPDKDFCSKAERAERRPE